MIAKILQSLLIVLAVQTLIDINAYSLTVEQAYKAIPHRQTQFDSKTSNLTKEHREYLTEVFRITDTATVKKVSLLMQYKDPKKSDGQKTENDTLNYQDILNSLYKLNPPDDLQTFHELIIDAITEHRDAFNNWSGGLFDYARLSEEPLVRSSSSKLKQAYGILMNQYTSENSHNRQAFFDHLCALDFI